MQSLNSNKFSKLKDYLFIHIAFLWYSIGSFFSKNASSYDFLSLDYIKWYTGVIVVMGVYAILWQQVLKKFPLTVAYANKATVTIWGILWGVLLWHETISSGQIIGIIIIVIGIICVAGGEKNESER